MSEFIELYYDLEAKKNSDMDVVLMGYEDCLPEHSDGPIMRPYHIVHFITGGNGTLHIGNQVFELGRGDIFYIPEDQIAHYYTSKSTPWQYSWCAFQGRRSSGFQYQFMTTAPEKYVFRGVDTEEYANVIKKAAVLKGTSASNFYYANSVLLEVMSIMAKRIFNNVPVAHIPSMAERIKYNIDLKYAAKLQIQELADELGIHPNYLSQIFRDNFGVSPKQYLMGLKMSKSVQLLTKTDLPISVISSSLGFEDQLAFSKSFKKRYGCSPTQYRKEYGSNAPPLEP